MLAFILRRLLQSIAVLAVVAFIAFSLFNYTGDPITFMVGQDATAAEKAAVSHRARACRDRRRALFADSRA